MRSERDDDAGITSLVAGLLTFAFGALAALGQVAVAAAFAVVTTLLLGFKPVLHRWVSALEGKSCARSPRPCGRRRSLMAK